MGRWRLNGARWVQVLAVTAVALDLLGGDSGRAQVPAEFVAHLWGREEVPTAETKATGVATFVVAPDGNSIAFRLVLSRVVNVQMAHIHLAPPGSNGPVVVWLYPSAPPPRLIPGRFEGELSSGTITATSLTGPLAGRSLASLLVEIRNLNAYVNVHTLAYPGGEIRGQILLR
ncbi:MAG: CHRD domain-containing protein [Armatimonadota bacterium]|nr:CHRD domain-containing protein [Armatimonadota bacterium]MDR7563474.1 CHRD domain-containing protein [Armatimonadota bacterium]MDR7567746.1 CHRD domain-containing protein [Armatimonadota bacterium]MDR7601609.1 CHRD domain-containing protein [Armatimonadota bacterium]